MGKNVKTFSNKDDASNFTNKKDGIVQGKEENRKHFSQKAKKFKKDEF